MGNRDCKILVVDDEIAILEILWEALLEKGCDKTACFFDSTLARDYLLENDIDMLITDLKMPHVGGLELARLALEKGVKKIIVISGSFFSVDDEQEKEIANIGGIVTIRKCPSMITELLQYVS